MGLAALTAFASCDSLQGSPGSTDTSGSSIFTKPREGAGLLYFVSRFTRINSHVVTAPTRFPSRSLRSRQSVLVSTFLITVSPS